MSKCFVVVEFVHFNDKSSKEIKAVFASEGEAEQCSARWNEEVRQDGDSNTAYWVEEANYYA